MEGEKRQMGGRCRQAAQTGEGEKCQICRGRGEEEEGEK